MLRTKFGCLIVILSLWGCQSTHEIAQQAPSYRLDAPLLFNVKTVDVVNSYVMPKKPPYVDHHMKFSLDDALVEWAHHRIQPGASHGYAIVTIEHAAIKQKPLKRSGNLLKTFARQQSDEYEAHGSVRIDFMDRRGHPTGSVFAQAKQRQTVLENTPQHELERVWNTLAAKVVEKLDHEIEKNIRREIPNLLQF